MDLSSISTINLATPSGELELLCSLPSQPTSKPAVFFLHGAFCSAHDFQFFLPYLAERGFPAYALSVRAHGNSWMPSTLRWNLWTTVDDYVLDIKAALHHIRNNHSAAVSPPVVVGHSFGGGHLQYFLAREGQAVREGLREEIESISGLVLLGSAPLSRGGRQIMANWEHVETKGEGYKYPWSPRSQLETADQVRDVFFLPSTPDATIETWRETCRSKTESIRVALVLLWPFGEARDVLAALEGLGPEKDRRKILCVAAGHDLLIKPEMVAENTEAYRAAVCGDGDAAHTTVMETTVKNSAHHMMMDIAWQECAAKLVDWIEGRQLD